ncbi:hypothetical protein [Zhongshania sp.]|uniref:hypothetical protein n=1 Tax=Zhongshania sp. TaxID=1971902 RepID=UPI0035651F7D
MDLYDKELAEAKALIPNYNYQVDQFSFEMVYEAPDPDAAGMFTVSYIVTATHAGTARVYRAVGGIGLDWLEGFEAALASGHFD